MIEKKDMQLKNINIVEHSTNWEAQFLREAELIKSIIPNGMVFIDHVGSTAVKGLPSKPIVDILVSLSKWEYAKIVVEALQSAGYHVDEECKKTPRYFLVKYSQDGSEGFHVHICEPSRRWGFEMLIFKAELSCDEKLREDYTALKRKLATEHANDVQSYIAGKRNFIDSKLRMSEREFGVNRLLTCQRAESDKAENIQLWMMIAQLILSIIAAASVFFNNNKILFVAAILGFFLVLLWLQLSQKQQRHRAVGDQSRRAVLLISGLGMELSAGQKLRIIDNFSVQTDNFPVRREEDHFASRESPGYKRLSELIEESSYWTLELQKCSAKVMGGIIFSGLLLVFVVGGAAIMSLESDKIISFSRAILAVMVFLISSDSLGLLLAYKSSAATIDEIFKRVESIVARGYQESDVLLLMLDYNAAIERAPSPLPRVFRFSRKSLGRRWRTYIGEKKQ